MNYIFSEDSMPAKNDKREDIENEKKQGVDEELRRKYRKTFLLNTRELKVLKSYCKKYRILNLSQFMRESIMTAILRKYDEDAPTLFEVKKVAEPEAKKAEKTIRPKISAPSQPDLFSCLQ